MKNFLRDASVTLDGGAKSANAERDASRLYVTVWRHIYRCARGLVTTHTRTHNHTHAHTHTHTHTHTQTRACTHYSARDATLVSG